MNTKKTLAARSVLCLCVSVAFLPICEAQTDVSKAEVQDISAPGSPLVISGTVTIKETFMGGGRVLVSTTEDIIARNISSKTILTLVAKLELVPAHGGPQEYTREYECFFAPDVIKPGDVHSLSGEGMDTADPYDSREPAQTARAQITVQYVQFIDGSIYGKQFFGEHILDVRRTAWRHLKRLNRIYTRHGEEAFVEELNESLEPSPVDVLIEGVRETQRNLGTETAIAQVRKMLNYAEEHKAGFTKPAEGD